MCNIVSAPTRQLCITPMCRVLIVSAECQYELWCGRASCSTHTCRWFERVWSIMRCCSICVPKFGNQCVVPSSVNWLTSSAHTYIVGSTSTRFYFMHVQFQFEIAARAQIGSCASQTILAAVRLIDWCGMFTELRHVVCNMLMCSNVVWLNHQVPIEAMICCAHYTCIGLCIKRLHVRSPCFVIMQQVIYYVST